eukprot:s1553_g6.t1
MHTHNQKALLAAKSYHSKLLPLTANMCKQAPVLLAAPRVPGENDRAVQAQAACSRTLGLPKWFLSEAQLPEFHCESPLRPVRGLQGLLLEGISEDISRS